MASGHYTSIKGSRIDSVYDESDYEFSSSSSRSELGNDRKNPPSNDDILSLNDSDDDDTESTITVSSDGSDMFASSETPANRIRRIEEQLELLIQSTVADEVNNLKPPGAVSLQEDMKLTEDELFAELRQARQELINTYSAYTRVTAALSGADAQCAMISREVNDLRLQVRADFELRD